MKILFLSPVLPWPLYSGGQIRAYHLLKALSQYHEVTLLSYIRDEKEKQYIAFLEKICRKVIFIKRQYKPWSIRTLIKTLFSSKPLLMNIYDLSKDPDIDLTEFEAIYCECFYILDKFNKTFLPVYLSEQNIEYLAYQRYVNNLSLLKRIILWLPFKVDLMKMRYWEQNMWRKAVGLCVMSENDKKIMAGEVKDKEITVIPNGVDVNYFSYQNKISADKTVLFVGNFSWFQNRQAVRWLIDEIWPKINVKVDNANLLIVGRGANGVIGDLGGMRDVRVESQIKDIRDAYNRAAVFLAPLKSGSGTKYKILEAMSCGVPVVTTRVGFEGFEGFEKTMVVKNTSDDLAKATGEILTNPESYQEMRQEARKLVVEKYDWEKINSLINNFIQKP